MMLGIGTKEREDDLGFTWLSEQTIGNYLLRTEVGLRPGLALIETITVVAEKEYPARKLGHMREHKHQRKDSQDCPVNSGTAFLVKDLFIFQLLPSKLSTYALMFLGECMFFSFFFQKTKAGWEERCGHKSMLDQASILFSEYHMTTGLKYVEMQSRPPLEEGSAQRVVSQATTGSHVAKAQRFEV